MNDQLIKGFFSRLIDWVFRRRSIASILVKTGGAIAIGALAINFIIHVKFGEFEFSVSTAGGVAQEVMTFALYAGLVGFFIGVAIAIWQAIQDTRREARGKIIVIEIRGLRDSADAPLLEADVGVTPGRRDELLVDLRQGIQDGVIVDPQAAVRKLNLVPGQISAKRSGLDRRDVQIVAGGLAPVPYLFVAGMYLDDEAPAQLLDWDRIAKVWRTLDSPDDKERFAMPALDAIPVGVENVVVAISVSYRAAASAIESTFAGWPVVELTLPNPRPDVHWSLEKQNALTAQFVQLMASLASKEVKQVHMVLASPASLAIRFGMGYDRRNMPDAIVYQYERSQTPQYPWGVHLPTHGIHEAEIIQTSKPT